MWHRVEVRKGKNPSPGNKVCGREQGSGEEILVFH
jgi:hypothetical protein